MNIQETLFNFDKEPSYAKSSLRLAAEAHIQKIKDEDLLTEETYLIAQLTLDLAQVCGVAVAKGSASAVAMASKELRETLAMLPDVSGGNSDFRAMAEKFGIAL
ncbi:hypothetical protein E4U03_07835 [Rothia nasimurium]|uniref:Uncharacterized protein n=1 Tax=Rothia nasimurium TaxID=85336 RepID=A0A4Y9F2V4_9MICC|nr:hypothetical protein [Rothia nasimurium]MBF0808518.1 hypothetical protein [Rothia nasimurium]TFU21912.1 hypothetical protein E4U03_07835 [Rothia nasimurium]